MVTQAQLWIVVGVLTAVALAAGLAERARNKRRNLDKPGWVPWIAIQLLALLCAIVLAALALLSR